MFKLWATIVKDFRILTRDKVGLALMFIMPILLVFVITSVQLSAFRIVNENKVSLLISNKDKGEASRQLLEAINKIGMFELKEVAGNYREQELSDLMYKEDALLAVEIPANFSEEISLKAGSINARALQDFGMGSESENNAAPEVTQVGPIKLYYHPVLQESYRQSIQGALISALQLVESRQILQSLYFSLNEKALPESLENDMLNNRIAIDEIPVSRDGSKIIPNATQHNVPAWTIFAMFFIVTSLGSNVVKEKLSGSFVRLKTLPTNYLIALISKMVTYIGVAMAQVFVIFSIGVFIFPLVGLPKLNLPDDILGLIFVSLMVAWCAISYAICIGVFAQTQEQANGFGAVSIVILAAIGGVLVPSFAMPETFRFIMKISPLHWALEAYYVLFLEGGKMADIGMSVLPLLGITAAILIIAIIGLKRKNLI